MWIAWVYLSGSEETGMSCVKEVRVESWSWGQEDGLRPHMWERVVYSRLGFSERREETEGSRRTRSLLRSRSREGSWRVGATRWGNWRQRAWEVEQVCCQDLILE